MIINFEKVREFKRLLCQTGEERNTGFCRVVFDSCDQVHGQRSNLINIFDTLRYLGIKKVGEGLGIDYDSCTIYNESKTIRYNPLRDHFVCHNIYKMFDKSPELVELLRERTGHNGVDDLKKFAQDINNFVEEQLFFIGSL